MATQLSAVYRAFGFEAYRLDSINGDAGSGNYSDSHVTVEVFVQDIGSVVVQDATYNFSFTNADGQPLSWHAARALLQQELSQLQLDGFENYTNYRSTGSVLDRIAPQDEFGFRTSYLKVPHAVTDSTYVDETVLALFPNPSGLHDPLQTQGGTFDDVDSALATCDSELSWEATASLLRANGYYVSGFSIRGEASPREWLTVRLSDGRFLSVDVERGSVLWGSFDQIVNEANGLAASLGRRELNEGVDLSDFLGPAVLLSHDGRLLWTDYAVWTLPRNHFEGVPGEHEFIGGSGIDG